MHAHFASPLQ
ncbi:unnamed protein product, partial [Adineta steineri]